MDVPARKAAAANMLQKLDLTVPADFDMPELTSAGAALGAAPAFDALAATRSPDDAARALQCLTQAVYYEAGNQSQDGQRAVAQVVLNRVRDRAFPASVCGVVYQGSTRSTGCQFTFTCDGSLNRRPNATMWERARVVASAALGGEVYAPVGSATFYHADYVSPWWASSMDRVTQIGAHIFYRWHGGMERALAFRQGYSGNESIPSPRVTLASASASVNSGVTVSYGTAETVGGVTIHRSAQAAVATVPAVASAATPAVATTQAVIRRPRTMIAGVRVHHGLASGPVGEDLSDKAVID
ncbi:MAG: cell wall hydrolase [Sphingomonas sp.]|nr:cell wall hydrolase [Sphingomonas sp.]